MKREEEILKASMIIANGKVSSEHFVQGAKWADSHPRKGLWDGEKVKEWLRENIYNRVYECGDRLAFPTADFLNALEKAMED